MQVNDSNPMVGLEGRSSLLFNLSKALKASPQFFGINGRPGNLIGIPCISYSNSFWTLTLDFLERESNLEGDAKKVPITTLWLALLDGLNTIWPSRLSLGGIPLGDVWPCPILKASNPDFFEGDDLVPFHKLTMWLTYSLVEVLDRILNWNISGVEFMTGLPEYRNGRPNLSIPTITLLKKNMDLGGLLVDHGVLTLKPDVLPVNSISGLPHAIPSHPAIVEWRAMTVIELCVYLPTSSSW